MNIYYQGEPGSYSNMTAIEVEKNLSNGKYDLIGVCDSFTQIWKDGHDGVLVLPIENSYAGNIHENLYNFLEYDSKIIGEYYFEVNHCLCSNEKDINDIKKVYSHPQALSQCNKYLKKHNIKAVIHNDTAAAAKMISQSGEKGVGSISSKLASEIYNLNIVDKGVQDQKGNTTRFLIVVPKESEIEYKNTKSKVSILFETKDIPAILYKCLGAFATNDINLTKVDSLPAQKDPFSYLFWIDFEGSLEDQSVKNALSELKYFTNFIRILGEY